MKNVSLSRTLTHKESLLGVFLALLIPALGAGLSIPMLVTAMAFGQ